MRNNMILSALNLKDIYNLRLSHRRHVDVFSLIKCVLYVCLIQVRLDVQYTISFISFLTTLALHVSGAICAHHNCSVQP
jgi:hypothetical protein